MGLITNVISLALGVERYMNWSSGKLFHSKEVTEIGGI
jgi:hypothetical protein